MAPLNVVSLAMVLILVSTGGMDSVMASPNMDFVSYRCNPEVFGTDDPFGYSLAYVLNDMVTVTANRPGYDYYTISPYPTSVAYGHASCHTSLSASDCVACIMSVKDQLLQDCPVKIGGEVVLEDCRMRYEQYPFSDN